MKIRKHKADLYQQERHEKTTQKQRSEIIKNIFFTQLL